MLLEFALVFVALLALLIYWIKNTYSFFEKLNIEHDKPTPILGSFKKVIFKQANLFDFSMEIYNKFTSKYALELDFLPNQSP